MHIFLILFIVFVILRITRRLTRPYRPYGRAYNPYTRRRHRFGSGLLTILGLVALDHLFTNRRP